LVTQHSHVTLWPGESWELLKETTHPEGWAGGSCVETSELHHSTSQQLISAIVCSSDTVMQVQSVSDVAQWIPDTVTCHAVLDLNGW